MSVGRTVQVPRVRRYQLGHQHDSSVIVKNFSDNYFPSLSLFSCHVDLLGPVCSLGLLLRILVYGSFPWPVDLLLRASDLPETDDDGEESTQMVP